MPSPRQFDSPQEAARTLRDVRNHEEAAIDDVARLGAFLSDLMPHSQLQRKALCAVVEQGQVIALESLIGSERLAIDRVLGVLERELGLQPSVAAWAVDSWFCYLHGRLPAQDLSATDEDDAVVTPAPEDRHLPTTSTTPSSVDNSSPLRRARTSLEKQRAVQDQLNQLSAFRDQLSTEQRDAYDESGRARGRYLTSHDRQIRLAAPPETDTAMGLSSLTNFRDRPADALEAAWEELGYTEIPTNVIDDPIVTWDDLTRVITRYFAVALGPQAEQVMIPPRSPWIISRVDARARLRTLSVMWRSAITPPPYAHRISGRWLMNELVQSGANRGDPNEWAGGSGSTPFPCPRQPSRAGKGWLVLPPESRSRRRLREPGLVFGYVGFMGCSGKVDGRSSSRPNVTIEDQLPSWMKRAEPTSEEISLHKKLGRTGPLLLDAYESDGGELWTAVNHYLDGLPEAWKRAGTR